MGCRTESADLLRTNSLRVTRQRMAVLTVLRHATGHVTASEVYERAQREAPEAWGSLNPSTVYRTLTQLRDLGLVSQTDLGTGERTYTWRAGEAEERHHHAVCTRCGAVAELPHAVLEDLSERIRAELGFRAELDHWAVYGECAVCGQREGDGGG